MRGAIGDTITYPVEPQKKSTTGCSRTPESNRLPKDLTGSGNGYRKTSSRMIISKSKPPPMYILDSFWLSTLYEE
jgi:hypothetical protein